MVLQKPGGFLLVESFSRGKFGVISLSLFVAARPILFLRVPGEKQCFVPGDKKFSAGLWGELHISGSGFFPSGFSGF